MTGNKVLGILAALIGLITVSGCGGGGDEGCDGATRGCVQVINKNQVEVGLKLESGETVVIPPATNLYPGTFWIRVDPTVGAISRFSAWTQQYSRSTSCVVRESTWSDPANPPTLVAQAYHVTLSALWCFW